MLFLMLAAVLFALLVGALAFVTGPVGLAMAAAIAVWLLGYAARSFLRSRSRSRSAGRRWRQGDGSERGAASSATAQRTAQAAHRV